jgi:Leucine-rich repeat (LRR) protein
VTALELDSNRLLGAVPSVIGDFTHMKRLSLENNFLVSVHTNIAQATHLEYLNVSWNNIGTVPSALSQLA